MKPDEIRAMARKAKIILVIIKGRADMPGGIFKEQASLRVTKKEVIMEADAISRAGLHVSLSDDGWMFVQ